MARNIITRDDTNTSSLVSDKRREFPYDEDLENNRTLRDAAGIGSHSCPQLNELEAAFASLEVPAGHSTKKISKEKEVKSHPIKNIQIEEPARWKGISISKVVSGMAIGLGGSIYYLGWKYRFLRLTPGVVGGFISGTYCGLKLCRAYHKNRKVKALQGRLLGLPLGEKGLLQMVRPHDRESDGSVASERVEYITHVLKLMWPFYEPNICERLVVFLNGRLEASKPHFIKRIHLLSLTFGSIPFDILEVRVAKEGEDEWHGNAHAALMIDLRGGGVLHPKFKRFNFVGTLRLAFTPLVPHFPGFGAMTLCLNNPPIIDFGFDIQKSMLSFVENQVRQFLCWFINDHVFGSFLVWPARVVIPILPEWQRGNLDHLELHTRGVLHVIVVESSRLEVHSQAEGFDSHVKPFVVLETVPLQSLSTKAISYFQTKTKNPLQILPDGFHPVWKEEHFLKVQELDQSLKVELLDDHYDTVMPSSSTAKRHGRKIGRVNIPLSELRPGEKVDKSFKLDRVDDSENRAIRSKHYGQDMLSEMWYLEQRSTADVTLRLILTYMPVEDLRLGKLFLDRPRQNASDAHYGLLFIRLLRAYNLKKVDYLSLSDPFCILSLNSAPAKRSRTVRDTLDPEWGESYEWYNISSKDILMIEVYSEGKVIDAPLGYVKIPVASIATECESNAKMIDTILSLTDGCGDIHVEIDWVPLDNNLMKSSDKLMNGLKTEPRGHLFVCLKWAIGLPNVGTIRMSDPYCILKVKGNEKRSQVVRNDLNPIWDEEFIWESVKMQDIIEVEVWAKGMIRDTILGTFKSTVEDITHLNGDIMEHSQPLMGENDKQGTIFFQIVWKRYSHGTSRTKKLAYSPDWPTMSTEPPEQKQKSLGGFFFF